ncbi:hypothetical protein GF407_17430 [candidate division KSB1 bacterium]|nr:hypothetical protein [candidate division KSB1 bacterium]
MKRHIYNISILFLLLALIAININTVMNGHFHLIGNGRILFHAHPFENGDSSPQPQSSHHSNTDLLLFGCMTSLLNQALLIVIFYFIFQQSLDFYAFTLLKLQFVFERIQFYLRAPPLTSPVS